MSAGSAPRSLRRSRLRLRSPRPRPRLRRAARRHPTTTRTRSAIPRRRSAPRQPARQVRAHDARLARGRADTARQPPGSRRSRLQLDALRPRDRGGRRPGDRRHVRRSGRRRRWANGGRRRRAPPTSCDGALRLRLRRCHALQRHVRRRGRRDAAPGRAVARLERAEQPDRPRAAVPQGARQVGDRERGGVREDLHRDLRRRARRTDGHEGRLRRHRPARQQLAQELAPVDLAARLPARGTDRRPAEFDAWAHHPYYGSRLETPATRPPRVAERDRARATSTC